MGKVIFHMIRIFSQIACAALMTMLTCGCEGDLSERLQSGRVLALQGLQGRWVGPVVPADKACGSATQGLMSVGEKGFGFDPFQSTTVIRGAIDKDGRLTGALNKLGADRQALAISFEGTASGVGSDADAIDGTVVSGRCRWKVTLHRG